MSLSALRSIPLARQQAVWSNLAYPLTALAAATWHSMLAVALVGTALMVASGTFHATGERHWQRADVTMVLTYVVTICAALASAWTFWGYAAIPLTAGLYWRYAWDINSLVHVPVFASIAVALTAITAGWWALLPVVLLVLGATAAWKGEEHGGLHGLWHLLTATASTAALLVA